MMGFLERQGKKLGTGAEGADLPEWKPGDIVFWKMSGGKDHVGIVSDVKTSGGLPYVIHNAGTPAEEDALTSWQIVGHFRYPKAGADTLKPKPENRT